MSSCVFHLNKSLKNMGIKAGKSVSRSKSSSQEECKSSDCDQLANHRRMDRSVHRYLI